MVYSIGNKQLNCLRKVLENETNRVWIAQDVSEDGNQEYYTVIIVKKHETVKSLMEIWEAGKRGGRNSCAEIKAYQDEFCVIYPYKEERPLEMFYNGAACSGKECEEICMNLITECISCGETWPVLYLMLKQKQVSLERDNSVSLGYLLDFSELEAEADERACVMKCADMVLAIMRQNKNMEKAIGMKLLQKKLLKEGYTCFMDLLRDVHMDVGSWEKLSLIERIKDFFRENRWMIQRILIVLSVVLGIAACLMIFSQLIFGDVPFLRIFTNSFKTIGKESLLN